MEKIIVFFFQNCERKSVFYYGFHNFLSQILWHEFTKSIYLKIISSILKAKPEFSTNHFYHKSIIFVLYKRRYKIFFSIGSQLIDQKLKFHLNSKRSLFERFFASNIQSCYKFIESSIK